MDFLRESDTAQLIAVVSAVVIPISGCLVWVVKQMFGRIMPSIDALAQSVNELAKQANRDLLEASARSDRLCAATDLNTQEIRRLSDRMAEATPCQIDAVQWDLIQRAAQKTLSERKHT